VEASVAAKADRRRLTFLALLPVFVLALSASWHAQQAAVRPTSQKPFRFLVMADPQFQAPNRYGRPELMNYGLQWTSSTWKAMPHVMRKLAVRRFFVCGDIFEYHDGDGTTVAGLWDVWDRYLKTFEGAGPVEWITGGHEFWGKAAAQARDLFLKRYPGHVRYRIVENGQAFILFDDTHTPDFLKPGGLEWLESTLEEVRGAEHVWFFGHVPPRNTADWWPTVKRPGQLDEYRSRMAMLLEKHKVRAAFFGHEHRPAYLGDRGGFPMIVASTSIPLLVEVRGEQVAFRWLMDPTADDPLETAVGLEGPPVESWRVAVLARGRPLPDDIGNTDPDRPATTDGAGQLVFHNVAGKDGVVDLGDLPGLEHGGRAIAVADYQLNTSWGARCARIRSQMPYSLWINGSFFESAPATRDRFFGYQMANKARNRAVLVLEVEGPGRRFTFVRHAFPPDIAAGQ
jgi:hypothetical protein